MPVPNYQTLMAPTLRALEDGQPRSASQVRESVAAEVGITEQDMLQVIKSGQPVFVNRVNWALTYMAQAGLLRRPKRGVNQITDRGRTVLQEHPERIDNNVLQTFEEFLQFQARTRAPKQPLAEPEGSKPSLHTAAAPVAHPTHSTTTETSTSGTPREVIQPAVDENNAAVAAELLSRVVEQPPIFLEHLVLRVLTAMGYGGAAGSTEQLGRSGDEGLDGVIRQDPLGLDRIYVQAKRYAMDRAVGRPDIQGFVGALHGAQADRGVFITTSRFSQDAYDYAEKVAARVILIDGATLAGLLVEHNIGAQNSETYVLKRVDEDFFEEP